MSDSPNRDDHSEQTEWVDDPPSPCVRNCCLDHDNICLGCHRSLTEICAWHEAPDHEKIEILTRCRARYRERFRRSADL